MTDQLQVAIDGSVAVLTIDNPPANTWTLESLNALPDLLADLESDESIRALVVTGAGEKFFSAGAELRTFADGDVAIASEMARAFGFAFEALAECDLVTIAAINGYAMGGGLETALACDMRIAESHAQMALPEASVGLLPCAGGTQRLPWLVGEGWAKRMILCGERVDADTALDIGLVEEVVDSGEAVAVAQELASRVQKQAPGSVVACKRLIHAAERQPLQTALAMEREEFVELFNSDDQLEGVTAFLEKRAPEWTNG
ncbi:MAG: enoyl-CoA hydratase [Abyssibacter sp.]|uniref:enoyl-CoA hydratase n=1 Tax=Abyssibacter sp. TaxID=2320200 RepID=UPI002E9D002E|nr:enoyl-CoA hydratase [Pseudomonadota bacterium]